MIKSLLCVLRASLIAIAGMAAIGAGQTKADEDAKMYPGSACLPTTNNTSAGRLPNGEIFGSGDRDTIFACPIVRDIRSATRTTGGRRKVSSLKSVTVVIHQPHAEDAAKKSSDSSNLNHVPCFVASMKQDGEIVILDKEHTTFSIGRDRY